MSRSDKFAGRRWNGSPSDASCATCIHFAPLDQRDPWPSGECRISAPTRGERRWPRVESRRDWCSKWVLDPTAGPLPDWTNKTHGEIAKEIDRGR